MAIKRYAGDKFTGLSSDTKPDNILAGSTFYETDTQLIFIYDGSNWEEVGYSASGHEHSADDITSGTFDDDRIAESNVTQHQAALSITESQISDLGDYLEGISGESIGDLSDVNESSPSSGHFLRYDGSAYVNTSLSSGDIPSLSASKITSGVFADARISESSVTQHESAISITESQITDFGNYQPISEKGAANGYASLNGSGTVPTSQLPAIAITETHVVADISARDALSVEEGDVAVVEDASADSDVDSGSATYIYDGTSWQLMQQPDDVVTSVNGETGTVVLNTDDVDEGSSNLYYTQTRFDSAFGDKDTDDLDEGASNLYFTNERVDDRLNNVLVEGTAITITYDDANNTLEISSTAETTPGGDEYDIQFHEPSATSGGSSFNGDSNFQWTPFDHVQKTAGYQRVEEVIDTIPSPSHTQTDKRIESETVGSDLVVRVYQRLGNGDDVIIASYVAPGEG